MEDAEEVDCDPELGTRWLSVADAFPLPVNFDPKFVSWKLGDRTKPKNLLYRGNHTGKTQIDCRQRMTGKRDLCQSIEGHTQVRLFKKRESRNLPGPNTGELDRPPQTEIGQSGAPESLPGWRGP